MNRIGPGRHRTAVKIVRATDALYALCTRVLSTGTHGVLQHGYSAQESRLPRCNGGGCSIAHLCCNGMRCAVGKRWQAGRACAGGVRPSRAAPSRAFDQVERSIADEYTVETELPRLHCRGRPIDRVPQVPLRAELLYSGTASRAPVIRRPKTNEATASRSADSDSDSDSDGPLARSRRDPAAHRFILPPGPSTNSAACPPTFTR